MSSPKHTPNPRNSELIALMALARFGVVRKRTVDAFFTRRREPATRLLRRVSLRASRADNARCERARYRGAPRFCHVSELTLADLHGGLPITDEFIITGHRFCTDRVASGMKLGREFQLYRRTMYAPRSSCAKLVRARTADETKTDRVPVSFPISFPVSFPVASGMKLGREFQLYRRTMYAPRSSAPNS